MRAQRIRGRFSKTPRDPENWCGASTERSAPDDDRPAVAVSRTWWTFRRQWSLIRCAHTGSENLCHPAVNQQEKGLIKPQRTLTIKKERPPAKRAVQSHKLLFHFTLQSVRHDFGGHDDHNLWMGVAAHFRRPLHHSEDFFLRVPTCQVVFCTGQLQPINPADRQGLGESHVGHPTM